MKNTDLIWWYDCLSYLNPIVTKLFIRGRELNIYLVFITQSYFAVPSCSQKY